jgi:anaerobic ribonucleoside-triphosphate reductase activating protein
MRPSPPEASSAAAIGERIRRPPARSAQPLRVGGVVPFTSIDYPGKLSAVVFVLACPWRCGYCHNPHLQARGGAEGPAWNSLLDWLRKRVGFLDAVVFSGGEPTVDPALPRAMADVRALGLAIGLHSAGTHPRRLSEVLPLTDWIGLDVKAPLDDPVGYARLTGIPGSAEAAARSVQAVLDSGVTHELRTTAHPAWLDDLALLRLAEDLARRGARRYALQRARRTATTTDALPDYPAPATLTTLHKLFEHFTLRSE